MKNHHFHHFVPNRPTHMVFTTFGFQNHGNNTFREKSMLAEIHFLLRNYFLAKNNFLA